MFGSFLQALLDHFQRNFVGWLLLLVAYHQRVGKRWDWVAVSWEICKEKGIIKYINLHKTYIVYCSGHFSKKAAKIFLWCSAVIPFSIALGPKNTQWQDYNNEFCTYPVRLCTSDHTCRRSERHIFWPPTWTIVTRVDISPTPTYKKNRPLAKLQSYTCTIRVHNAWNCATKDFSRIFLSIRAWKNYLWAWHPPGSLCTNELVFWLVLINWTWSVSDNATYI